MASDLIAQAKASDKLNAMFPLLNSGDAPTASQSTLPATGTRAQHSQVWETLWANSSFLPWERGAPHPALHDALMTRRDLFGSALPTTGRRCTALVPGCGRGYDVFMLRSFGYDALGIDISGSAVKGAAEVEALIREGKGPGDGLVDGVGYATKDTQIGEGSAKVELGDFFTMEGQFDLIFDYTFLSALPPSLRPQWAASMARLLAPNGRLICVEFPTQKPTDSGGPPWATPEDAYVAHLHQPGTPVRYDDRGRILPEDACRPIGQGGLERLARWAPERSHAAGTGTDRASVWRHAA